VRFSPDRRNSADDYLTCLSGMEISAPGTVLLLTAHSFRLRRAHFPSFPSTMLAAALCLVALAGAGSCSNPQVLSAPVRAPSGVSNYIDNGFVSFSIAAHFFPEYAGTEPTRCMLFAYPDPHNRKLDNAKYVYTGTARCACKIDWKSTLYSRRGY
jgi:hypothetical protein